LDFPQRNMVALNVKRRVFVEEYLRDFNATQAAIRAGYSERTAYSQGQRLLKFAEVQEYVEKRLQTLKMGTDEGVLRLAEQARAEYARYLLADGSIDLQKMVTDSKGHLIKATKWDARGNLTIEFYDAQSALVQVGKAHGLFKDTPGVNVEVNFDPEGWKRQREEWRRKLNDVDDDDVAEGTPTDS